MGKSLLKLTLPFCLMCWVFIAGPFAQETPKPKPKPKPSGENTTPANKPRSRTARPGGSTKSEESKPAAPASQPESAGLGSLLLVIDMDCRITLDGRDLGAFREEENRAVRVGLGQHLLKAVSADKKYKWERELSVENSKQVIVRLQLGQVKAAAEESTRREAAAKERAEAEARTRAEEEERRRAEARARAEADERARKEAEEDARRFENSRQEQIKAMAAYAERAGRDGYVQIQPGEFMMGDKNNGPAHKVRISRWFEMGKYEVTQGQWQAVMGNNPSGFKGTSLPVENVSWEDAQNFISRLNGRNDGYVYRLPTEAEWEYACRAGTTGDYAGNLYEMAWYENNSGNQTHPVGQKKPNAWGLYDMHGNVWEWVQDWYDSYSGKVETDPQGSSTRSGRVNRGGGWISTAAYCRSAVRRNDSPGYRDANLGFRLVRTPR